MPYFSFILDNQFLKSNYKELENFKLNTKYFSKNTRLWSRLKKIEKRNNIIFSQKEKREKYKKKAKSILFCLPPSIGVGDAIEYAFSIKSIILNNNSISVGVAHAGDYVTIFKNQFNILNTFDFMTDSEIKLYETTFHFTLEIKELALQKYNRQNIEKLITNFFNVPIFRNTKKINNKKRTSNKKIISIFPISKSPIRSLPLYILSGIIKNFEDQFIIEIYLSNNSVISDYIYKNLQYLKNIKFKKPKNINLLTDSIKKINFGIFCDSGPLHLAKMFNKQGVLIISSVNEKILLNNFSNIKPITSKYESEYCNGPCGLVNAIEFNNNCGCYDSLKIKKQVVTNMKNLNSLQRGNLKNNYINLYINSVNCYRYFDIKKINTLIEDILKKN